jgi:tight adherence protein C
MDLLIIIAASSVTLLMLAAALGMILLSDSATNSRLARYARLTPVMRGARSDQVTATLRRIGAVAGRGSLEGAARASLRARLIQAGFYADHAIEAFFAVRVITALSFGLFATLAVLLMRAPGTSLGLVGVMLAVAVGLYAPNLLLGLRIKDRARAMRFGLPDAVDLMVVCLEAGGTLTSAIQRVESEFRDLHPVISEQLGIVLLEMQAGASRTDALGRFAERAGSEEIRSLVTTLVQSEALGASVAQTMRVFAQQTRDARYLDAERRASELPVKMAFPLVLFIFPSLMTVIFTPLVIRILRQLLQR